MIDQETTQRFVMFLDRTALTSKDPETADCMARIATHLHAMHSRILDLELELAKINRKFSVPPPADLSTIDDMLDELDPTPEIVLGDEDVQVLT